jgi:hypothetical protein
MLDIAVEDLTLDTVGFTGTVNITSAPSTNTGVNVLPGPVKKGVYTNPLNVTISGATSGSCTQTAPFLPFSISATAVKSKVDGNAVMRVTDQVPISIPGTQPGPSACTITGTLIISDAGQDKAKAD